MSISPTGRALLMMLLFLAGACQKEKRPEPEAVPLPAELKAYTLFRPGTYWIYQDSASRQLDSVWVVSLDESIKRLGYEYPDMKHETFRLQTRSRRGGPDQVYRVERNCGMPNRADADNHGSCWAIRRSQYLPGSTADEGGTDVFPYRIERDQAGFIVGDFTTMYPYWHSQPQTIGGVRYHDLLEVKLTRDASEDSWPIHYAWAPGLGIVRQRIRRASRPQTWTLVRSRIVQ